MFLLIPTWACYRRADDGVRSPTDNVPNWVEMVTGRPFREASPVKGKGLSDRVKISECPHASLSATDLLRCNRSKATPLCE